MISSEYRIPVMTDGYSRENIIEAAEKFVECCPEYGDMELTVWRTKILLPSEPNRGIVGIFFKDGIIPYYNFNFLEEGDEIGFLEVSRAVRFWELKHKEKIGFRSQAVFAHRDREKIWLFCDHVNRMCSEHRVEKWWAGVNKDQGDGSVGQQWAEVFDEGDLL